MKWLYIGLIAYLITYIIGALFFLISFLRGRKKDSKGYRELKRTYEDHGIFKIVIGSLCISLWKFPKIIAVFIVWMFSSSE